MTVIKNPTPEERDIIDAARASRNQGKELKGKALDRWVEKTKDPLGLNKDGGINSDAP